MMPKRQPNIRTRLLRALMLMTLLTLGMVTIFSAIMDLQLMRHHMLRDLQVLAEVVGKNCVSALVFDNPETARRHLSTLDREYQIRRALLYDAEGREFARWQRESTAMPDPGHVPPGAEGLRWILEGRVMASQTIDFDGHPVGRIVIEARLDELYRQLRQYFLFAGALAALTLAAALAFALRLQRRISSPILALARQSRRISEQKASSNRITDPMAGEELATLVDGFNAVLDVIEQRKSELARHVEALNRANSQLRRLATDMALIEESERARLAGELHDSPMQKLALAQMQIDAARRENDDESEEQLAAGVQLLSEGIAEIRTLQFDLSPPVLHQRGLPAALEWLAKSTTSR
jgi:methyl-accepting chemotaxis protein